MASLQKLIGAYGTWSTYFSNAFSPRAHSISDKGFALYTKIVPASVHDTFTKKLPQFWQNRAVALNAAEVEGAKSPRNRKKEWLQRAPLVSGLLFTAYRGYQKMTSDWVSQPAKTNQHIQGFAVEVGLIFTIIGMASIFFNRSPSQPSQAVVSQPVRQNNSEPLQDPSSGNVLDRPNGLAEQLIKTQTRLEEETKLRLDLESEPLQDPSSGNVLNRPNGLAEQLIKTQTRLEEETKLRLDLEEEHDAKVRAISEEKRNLDQKLDEARRNLRTATSEHVAQITRIQTAHDIKLTELAEKVGQFEALHKKAIEEAKIANKEHEQDRQRLLDEKKILEDQIKQVRADNKQIFDRFSNEYQTLNGEKTVLAERLQKVVDRAHITENSLVAKYAALEIKLEQLGQDRVKREKDLLQSIQEKEKTINELRLTHTIAVEGHRDDQRQYRARIAELEIGIRQGKEVLDKYKQDFSITKGSLEATYKRAVGQLNERIEGLETELEGVQRESVRLHLHIVQKKQQLEEAEDSIRLANLDIVRQKNEHAKIQEELNQNIDELTKLIEQQKQNIRISEETSSKKIQDLEEKLAQFERDKKMLADQLEKAKADSSIALFDLEKEKRDTETELRLQINDLEQSLKRKEESLKRSEENLKQAIDHKESARAAEGSLQVKDEVLSTFSASMVDDDDSATHLDQSSNGGGAAPRLQSFEVGTPDEKKSKAGSSNASSRKKGSTFETPQEN